MMASPVTGRHQKDRNKLARNPNAKTVERNINLLDFNSGHLLKSLTITETLIQRNK
jgi:hypothetical protein